MHSRVIDLDTGASPVVRDLTSACVDFLSEQNAGDGLLHVFVPHATAGLAILETGSGSDADLLAVLDVLLPPEGPGGPARSDPRGASTWSHRHGSPGHGRDHVLPALLPPYATLPVFAGRLALGTWQSVCLVDTNVDNRTRQVRLTFLPG